MTPEDPFWRGLSGTNSGGPFAPGRFCLLPRSPSRSFSNREAGWKIPLELLALARSLSLFLSGIARLYIALV